MKDLDWFVIKYMINYRQKNQDRKKNIKKNMGIIKFNIVIVIEFEFVLSFFVVKVRGEMRLIV